MGLVVGGGTDVGHHGLQHVPPWVSWWPDASSGGCAGRQAQAEGSVPAEGWPGVLGMHWGNYLLVVSTWGRWSFARGGGVTVEEPHRVTAV